MVKVMKEMVVGLERSSQRNILNLVKEKCDDYSRTYMFEALQLARYRPEIIDQKQKLSVSHYRTLCRTNMSEDVRGLIEGVAVECKLSVRQLKDKIKEYKDEKAQDFNLGDVKKSRELRKEIADMMKDFTVKELKEIKEKVLKIHNKKKVSK